MRVLAFSPHLDDAVFSAGATLAAHALGGDTVRVVTCFTGSVASPTGFALACQRDKGLEAEADYMALRRAEDREACAAIGAEAAHLPLLEAPHRGYDSAAALFAGAHPGDDIAPPLREALAREIAAFAPDTIYAPFGVGNHVDHLAVRAALEAVASALPVVWWEDYPYAMREAAAPRGIVRVPVSGEPARRKRTALLAYRSQLGFQFGGADAAAEALDGWKHEGLTQHMLLNQET
ncbi:PIG-L deacetylase family protein [Tsuneonella amylolytica]|uniref:PIG-L deacetylase family protein n=1 Tax=Tsuneonella amylolytica TaxID=2338327 RepID=UPI000EAA23BB|nr:PIG-L family deacetylase [Tsuneonella amylolytica]